MIKKFSDWINHLFSDSDVNKLLLVIAVFSAVLWLFVSELAVILGGILIAYVLEGPVQALQRRFNMSRTQSVVIVIITAMVVCIISFYALPRFLLELRQLGDRIPQTGQTLTLMVEKLNTILPAEAQLDQAAIGGKVAELTGQLATYFINNLVSYAGNIFSLILYVILLPLLVFFLLRDKAHLMGYMRQFMPRSTIFTELWEQIDEQFGSYIRGKILEAWIVGASTWIVLLLFKMEYALALAIMVGLSVFIPFVGAIAVTFPVVMFAYLQFGAGPTFLWIVLLYGIIQAIDGQILVPLLFSEVIKIHPVALFTALIFFGNLWGVLGIFFAIPLASLIKCTITVIMKRRAAAASP